MNVISVTTAVGIFFSGDNFNAVEALLNMPVMVTKDSPIATPIVVDLIPLTVNETRERDPLLLQESIPPDNPFSPPFACKNLQCIIGAHDGIRFTFIQI